MTATGQIECVDVVELVTDYLEGVLDPATVREFEAHLASCDGCEIYLDQMRSTIDRLGHVPLATLSADAVQTLVQAFRDVGR